MRELIEKLIGEIYNEQLRYDECSHEYRELASLVKLLEDWLQEHC